MEYDALADGSVLAGNVVPGRKDNFIISTFNEETGMNTLCVYRKQKL